MPDSVRLPHRLLVGVTVFVALSAFLGGAGLILDSTGAAVGMSPGMLDATPFATFLIPGLLLYFVVGGSAALAALALVKRRATRHRLALTSGVVLLTWLLVQMALIGGPHVLQLLYLAAGASTVALAAPGAWQELSAASARTPRQPHEVA